jgi:starch synthase (maltosyl-transferring)
MTPLSVRLQAPANRPLPPAPIPIACVITELDPGGAERQLVLLLSRLDRARWSPAVYSLSGQGVLADELRARNIPVVAFQGRKSAPFALMRDLTRALRLNPPALVQSFLCHANVASRIAARRAGVACHLGGIRVAEPRKTHLRLEAWTQSLGTGSVCVSEGVRQHLIKKARIDPRRLVVIPNAVDPAPFAAAPPIPRAELQIPDNAFLLLAVGRLDPQKGYDTLLDALAGISAHPATTRPVFLAIAGAGPQADALQKLERSLWPDPARSPVRWLGFRADVPRLLATADLLVLPSRWEGMPNVVLEAMAAAKPVIATQIPGVTELVIPGQTGWIIPPAAPALLAQAITEAAETPPDLLAQLGRAGCERVFQNHQPDRIVHQYESLWLQLLQTAP